VSGEYAMIAAVATNGWLDRKKGGAGSAIGVQALAPTGC